MSDEGTRTNFANDPYGSKHSLTPTYQRVSSQPTPASTVCTPSSEVEPSFNKSTLREQHQSGFFGGVEEECKHSCALLIIRITIILIYSRKAIHRICFPACEKEMCPRKLPYMSR